jgi:hypothetical protein
LRARFWYHTACRPVTQAFPGPAFGLPGSPPGVEAVPVEIASVGETMTGVELASRVSVFLASRLTLFALCVAIPLGLGWLVGWMCS